MENKTQEIDLVQLLKSIWTHRKKVIKWAILGAFVGLVIAFSIPKEYQTIVKIAPEGAKKTNSSASGLAAIAGLDIGGGSSMDGISEKLYPQIMSSSPFLLEFASITVSNDQQTISFYDYITKEQKSPWWSVVIGAPMQLIGWTKGLFSEKTKENLDTINIFQPSAKQKDYISNLQKSISTVLDKKSGVIEITTTMQDPMIAAIIADSIVVKLQRYMIDYRTNKTRADLEQNIKMCDNARNSYYTADSMYATALDRNQNLISQSAKIKLERLANEKEVTFGVYQQLSTNVEITRVKLQEETPIATILEPASVANSASSPKKLLLLMGFTFLGALIGVFKIVIKQLYPKQSNLS